MKILILGAGMMGRAAAYFLSKKEDIGEVILADMDINRAKEIAETFDGGKITPVSFNATDANRIRELMTGCSVAIGATSYEHNLLYAKTAIETHCSFIDLGGNHDVVDEEFKLNEEAKKAGVTIIPDCGLAPGLVSILSARALTHLDKTETINIRVGGIPVDPMPPLNYCLLFNVRGLINEYIERSRIIKDHEIIEVDSMFGLEKMYFPEPFGEMEAFYTSGGISTLTSTMKDKVTNLDYKTIRYPGHQRYIKFLIDLGMTAEEPIEIKGVDITPRRFLEKTLEKNLTCVGADAILLRVTATGTEHGIKTVYTQEHIDFYDMENNLTAMMRMTAFPSATVALMIARGDIGEKGVLYQEESVPFEPFFRELEKEGIVITTRKQQISKVGADS